MPSFAARIAAALRSAPAGEDPSFSIERGEGGARLDLRGLEPPEPMRRILVAVAAPENLPLVAFLDREPRLLYPRLAERGLRWAAASTDGGVELRIDVG